MHRANTGTMFSLRAARHRCFLLFRLDNLCLWFPQCNCSSNREESYSMPLMGEDSSCKMCNRATRARTVLRHNSCAVRWKSAAHSRNMFVVQKFSQYFKAPLMNLAWLMLYLGIDCYLVPVEDSSVTAQSGLRGFRWSANPVVRQYRTVGTSTGYHLVIPHARVNDMTLVLRNNCSALWRSIVFVTWVWNWIWWLFCISYYHLYKTIYQSLSCSIYAGFTVSWQIEMLFLQYTSRSLVLYFKAIHLFSDIITTKFDTIVPTMSY